MANDVIEGMKAMIMQRVETLKAHPAMAELIEMHTALNAFEKASKEPITNLSELFGLEIAAGSQPTTIVTPGQFYGKKPADAAKEYLQRKGRSATLEEIIDALKTGSCDPGAKDKFGLSLARSTFSFVKIGDNIFDLLDRYPDVKEKRLSGLSAPKRKENGIAPTDSSSQEAEAKAAETA